MKFFQVRIRGEFACFTRPEFKTERLTYDVLTPSAARGILEAVFWKPAIRWEIRKILLLAPVRYFQLKRNEVTSRASVVGAHRALRHASPLDYFADEDRTQRNTVGLRDVDYAVEAGLYLTARQGPDDNPRKFEEMFRRRLEKGQYYTSPYLGCREFPAIVEPYDGNPRPLKDVTCDLGYMLHDLRFGSKKNEPVFFRAQLRRGVIDVPKWEATTT